MKPSTIFFAVAALLLLVSIVACSSPTPIPPTPVPSLPPSPTLTGTPTATPFPSPTFVAERVLTKKLTLQLDLGTRWDVSPDLHRFAYATRDGDKMVMIVDGVAGATYDAIQAGPVFSPDGKRIAYLAIKNSKLVAVIDGKEDPPYADEFSSTAPAFSPDSRHVAYAAGKNGKKVLVLDGKEYGPYDEIEAISFSRAGGHIAYWAQVGKQWRVVADGKEGKLYDDIDSAYLYSDRSIGISDDGQHIVYRAVKGKTNFIVIDGKEGKAYDEIGYVYMSSLGAVAYTARTGESWRLVKNEEESSPYEAIGQPVYSPDGKSLAYGVQTSGKWAVISEEGASKTYDRVGIPMFSSDSQHMSVIVSKGDKMLVLSDGQEEKAYDEIAADDFTYSPDGLHHAYSAVTGNKHVVVADGVEGPAFDDGWLPVYSSDSQHLAYAIQAGTKRFIVLDGKPGPGYDRVSQPVFDRDGVLHHLALEGEDVYLIESRLVTTAASLAEANQTATAIADANSTMVARAQPTLTAIAQEQSIRQAQATATVIAESTATAVARANATATAKAIPVVANPSALDWPLVIQDPFDKIGNNWGTGSFSFDSGKVAESIANGKYTWDLTATSPYITRDLPTMIDVRDFAASIDARRLSGTPGSAYGLAFRDPLYGGYYLFLISDDQSYQFAKGSGPSAEVLQKGKSNAIRPGRVNRLSVIARGAHFSFYVNNQKVLEADDDRLDSGVVGPAAQLFNSGDRATFEFDNFEVRVPTVGPSLAEARKWKPIVSETFNKNEIGWPLDDTTDTSPTTAVIANGVYRWTAASGESWVKWEIPDQVAPVGDAYIGVTAKQVSGPATAGYGFVLRENDTHDGAYGLEVRDDGKFRILKVDKGKISSLVSWTTTGAIKPKQANQLSAIASGPHLSFFINGMFVAQVDDDRFKIGRAGILFELGKGESGVFEYDGFEIRAP